MAPATISIAACGFAFLLLIMFLDRGHRMRRPALTYGAALLALPVAYFSLAWNRFGVPYTDMGQILYVPLRILDGQRLYEEVFWIHGPLEPYLNAALYSVFGRHTAVMQCHAMAVNCGILALVYALTQSLAGPRAGFCAGLLTFALCVTQPYMSFPYTFSAQYSLLFALGWLVLAYKYVTVGGARRILLLGCAAGLGGLAKQSYGFYVCAAGGLFLAWDLARLSPARATMRRADRWLNFAVYVCAAGILALAPYAWLLRHAPQGRELVWRTVVPVFHAEYYTVWYPAALTRDLLSLGQLSWIGALQTLMQHWVVLGGIALGGWTLARGRRDTPQARLRLALYLVALGSLLTWQQFFHAGFVLPLWIIVLITSLRPDRVDRAPATAVDAAVTVAVVAACALIATAQLRQDLRKDTLLQSDAVRLYDTDDAGGPVKAMADHIRMRAHADDGLVVVGHPQLLHLLTGLDTPLRYTSMHIPGFVNEKDEAEIIRRLDEARTRFVVLPAGGIIPPWFAGASGKATLWNAADLPENQPLEFGRHYCRSVGEYLKTHYRQIAAAPGLKLLERN